MKVARVLIADDAAFMRSVMRQILENGGHEVVAEAENGQDAVTKYNEFSPDIVTMDITMPIMDGIEAVRQIVGEHPKASILMCSAMAQKQIILDAIDAGARGFVVKPFDGNKVLMEISNILV